MDPLWQISDSYLESNKDWDKFNSGISDNTGKHYMDLWVANARSNRGIVKEHGWACPEFQGIHKRQATVLLGASPAINNQLDRLRELQHDTDFAFLGISSGLENMIRNGIRPKYVMIADADPKMDRFWSNLEMNDTKDTTLIASVCTHPNLLKMWKGDIKFLGIYTDDKEFNRKLRKWYRPLNGNGHFFHAISSQYNTGAAIGVLVFESPILIFVGNELGFKDREVPYYADRKDYKDNFLRRPHPDIYGNVYYSTEMLMSLKQTLEDFLGKISGAALFFNATEAGIFGVSRRYGNLPWILNMKLDMAVKQTKSFLWNGRLLTA